VTMLANPSDFIENSEHSVGLKNHHDSKYLKIDINVMN